jgi:hypothetical protein
MMASTPASLLRALDLLTLAPMPEIETLGAARSSHFARVRSITDSENIVAVGISEKESDGERTGELSVCFYVRKKLAPNKVKASDAVPPVLNAPGGKAVVTDVKEIGKLAPEIAKKSKPLQSGFSVGHVRSTAGTLGAIVKRDGKLYLLSNCHVLARSGNATVGDQIVYPGPADGGRIPANLVARLSHFSPFDTTGTLVNRVDAALAEVDRSRLAEIVFDIDKATAPFATIRPSRGMKVAKAGRTTGKTKGEIIDVNFRFVLQYSGVAGKVGFVDQVLCTRYTDAGDSGSIVVDGESGKIVGLHFAGAESGSVFNPIQPVISALQFKFVAS